MKSVRRMSVVLALAIFLGGISMRANSMVGTNEFRRTKGTYTFDKYGSELRFITAKDGKLSVAIDFKWQDATSKSTSGTAFDEKGIIHGEGWFVYFETPGRIWIFDGVDGVQLVEHKRDNEVSSSSSTSSFKARSLNLEKCPAAVLEALPDSIRKKAAGR
jgi:hypothetical protein